MICYGTVYFFHRLLPHLDLSLSGSRSFVFSLFLLKQWGRLILSSISSASCLCWRDGNGLLLSFSSTSPLFVERMGKDCPPIFIGGQWITFRFVFLLHLWDISNLYPEYAYRVIRRLYPDWQSKQGSKLKKNSKKFIMGPDRNPCISLEAISPHDK